MLTLASAVKSVAEFLKFLGGWLKDALAESNQTKLKDEKERIDSVIDARIEDVRLRNTATLESSRKADEPARLPRRGDSSY